MHLRRPTPAIKEVYMCQTCGCTSCKTCGMEIKNGVCVGCGKPSEQCTFKKKQGSSSQ